MSERQNGKGTVIEEIEVAGSQLLERVKELAREGNALSSLRCSSSSTLPVRRS